MTTEKWFQVESQIEKTSGDPDRFWVGCADYSDRETLMFIIEAARKLCGMRPDESVNLLEKAASNLHMKQLSKQMNDFAKSLGRSDAGGVASTPRDPAPSSS